MAKNPIVSSSDQQPTPFDLCMSDDALVTFGAPAGPDALSFQDIGYMPVNALTIGGSLQQLQGGLDGMFIRYNADGVQHFATTGGTVDYTKPTTADYTRLQYDLVGYKGDATFGHAADGTPTFSGAKHLTVLAQGDLISGHLGFGATGGIAGELKTSLQIDGQAAGTLDITVQHTGGDIGATAAGGLTLDYGALHASFVPLGVT